MTQDETERVYMKELRERIKLAEDHKGPWPTARELLQALSASEKRAGEAEFKLADDQYWKLKAEQAESSLARVQPVYDAALAWCRCYLTEGNKSSENELREAIRSSLHIPPGG